MGKRSKKQKRKINRMKNKLFRSTSDFKKVHLHEFPVMATMSSGKSTLINALLGEELLPNENQACTSKIFRIIDRDGIKQNRYKIIKKNNLEEENLSSLEKLNKDSSVKEVIIEGDFKGIENKFLNNELHRICLVDTPGPNNSLEGSHAEIAYDLIESDSSTHIIYVLNGTQLGVNDDKNLLIDITERLDKAEGDSEVIFVLNKMDEIDQEVESVISIVNNVKKYLLGIGINNPKIIPVSAYAAKLFKLGLNNSLKTRKENNDFKKFYSFFGEFKISKSKTRKNYTGKSIFVKSEEFKYKEVMERLHATGIIDLEKALSNSLKKRIKSIA